MHQEFDVIVFTNEGATYRFFNVNNFKKTETGIDFWYVGKSTGTTRNATFNNTSMTGYSIAAAD